MVTHVAMSTLVGASPEGTRAPGRGWDVYKMNPQNLSVPGSEAVLEELWGPPPGLRGLSQGLLPLDSWEIWTKTDETAGF